MIQIQLIQVEMSTTMRGDWHASTVFHFPIVVLSDVFGVRAGIRGELSQGSADNSVGKRVHPAPIAGRNTWLTVLG